MGLALASQLNFSSSFGDLLLCSAMVDTQEFAASFCTYSIWILTSRGCRVSTRFTLERRRRPGFACLGGKTVGIAAGALSLCGFIPSIEVPSIKIHRSRNARNVVNEREDLSVKRFLWQHPPAHDIILGFQRNNESKQKYIVPFFSLGCYHRQQHSVEFCSDKSANAPVQVP